MKNNQMKTRDMLQQNLAWFFAGLTVLVCAGIVLFLFIKGYRVVNWQFLTSETGTTIGDMEKAGGILTPIVGTFMVTIMGSLLALPWALATALYLSEYAKKNLFTHALRMAIDVLSGVPTIVIAIFCVAVFTMPQLGFLSSMVVVEGAVGASKAFGKSFLVCGMAMAVMILPFVTKTCEEAIKSVPQSYREASLALGASKWDTMVNVVVPSANRGIVTAVVLGMGRIIGDTAIVWLLLGGTLRMTGRQPWWQIQNWISTMRNTGATLTTYIFFNSPAGEGDLPEMAYGASLVLITIIIFLNGLVAFLGKESKEMGEER